MLNNNPDIIKYDTITVFFYMLAFSNLSFLHIIAPIFVITATVLFFHPLFHSGSIKNFLIRQKYKDYLKKIFLTSIKNIWILPLMMIILFAGFHLITRNFDFANAIPKILGTMPDGSPIISSTITTINPNFYYTPIKLMITFFLVLIFHSIVYSNIGLIMCKKNSNIIVCIVASFLVFICANVFSEIGLGTLFIKVLGFKELSGVFNIFGIWGYGDITALEYNVIYALILVVISYVALFITYKNKEEVIIQSEK